MIIRTKENLPTGLVGVQNVDDKVIFTHRANITPHLQEAYELRQQDNNGFTKDKSRQHIAHIPAHIFAQHPEFTHDPNLIVKWLRTEEGAPYCTCRRSGL